jgi:hypothetical protein
MPNAPFETLLLRYKLAKTLWQSHCHPLGVREDGYLSALVGLLSLECACFSQAICLLRQPTN